MIKTNPETLNEMRALRNIMTINKYYSVSEEFLNQAYDFIIEKKTNIIRCNTTEITFNQGLKTIKTFKCKPPIQGIDGLIVKQTSITIIPHYEPSHYTGGGSYSGGSSNNNNNNNNNH